MSYSIIAVCFVCVCMHSNMCMLNESCPNYVFYFRKILSKVRFGEIKRVWWTKERCRARFNTSLGDHQLAALCDECPMLVPAIITGAWSATVQCQLAFIESKWRCDVFKRGPYFGQFAEEGINYTYN